LKGEPQPEGDDGETKNQDRENLYNSDDGDDLAVYAPTARGRLGG
jgi:hypothetical protein